MDIAAAAIELLGAWMVGNKDRRGFIALLVGSALWFVVGFQSGLWGLVCIGVAFAAVNIRNYRRWA